MRRASIFCSFLVLATLGQISSAQEAPAKPADAAKSDTASEPSFEPAKATKQHRWLKQLRGVWSTVSTNPGGDGQPASEMQGKMMGSMVGDLWLVGRMSGEIPGGESFNAVLTLGFDESKKKFVGTWVDSMMNHMWQYEGELDSSGKKLVLMAEGPNFMGEGDKATFRDSYEVVANGRIRTRSEIKKDDGQWQTIMTGEMTRAKRAKKAKAKSTDE